MTHSRTIPSASCLPSDENATASTECKWLSSIYGVAPVAASYNRTIPSLEPDTSCLSSGRNATGAAPVAIASNYSAMALPWPQILIQTSLLVKNSNISTMTLGTKLQRPSQPREWPIAVLDFAEASQSSGQEEQKVPRSGAKSIKVEKDAHRRFLSELYYESSCLFNWIDLFDMQNLSQFLSLQFHFYSSAVSLSMTWLYPDRMRFLGAC